MPNPWYTNNIDLLPATKARSGDIDANFEAVQIGFDSAYAASVATGGSLALKANLAGGNTWTGAQDFTGATMTIAAPTVDASPATRLYVDQRAMNSALPGQAGNAGKLLTTDGTNATWTASIPLPLPGDVGRVLTVAAGPTLVYADPRGMGATSTTGNVVLTSASSALQRIVTTVNGNSVTLPDATTMMKGTPAFMLSNEGGFDLEIRTTSGARRGFVRPAESAIVGLSDNSTAEGVWTLQGAYPYGVLASNEVTFPLSLGSTGTGGLRTVVALDSTRDLLIYAGDARMYGVVWDSSACVFGTPVLIRAATFSPVIVAQAIKSATNQVLCASFDSTTGMSAVVLSFSGTTITVNTAATATLAGAFVDSQDLVAIAGQGYVVAYSRATNVNGIRALTISGTTVSIGAESALTGTIQIVGCPVQLFDAGTSRVLTFSATGSTGYVKPFTVSGTTLTAGTEVTFGAAGNRWFVRSLASGRWAVVTVDSGIKGAIFTLTGTVASATIVSLSAANSSPTALVVIGSQIIVASDAAGTPREINVLTDNAGTAVAGTVITRNGAVGANTAMLGFDATSLWYMTTSATNVTGDYVRVGISGNNPVILSVRPVDSVAQDVGGWPTQPTNGGAVVGNAFVGKNILPPGVLQGTLCSIAALGSYGNMTRCSAGSIAFEPRIAGLNVTGAVRTANNYTRSADLKAQWSTRESNAGLSFATQKIGIA